MFKCLYDSRRSGEIGKHAAFRTLWEQSLGGSSPLFGTPKYQVASIKHQVLEYSVLDT